MINRRAFLRHSAMGTALGAGALTLPFGAAHALENSDMKFIFVFASGGWDTTRVFATEFGNNNVDMEADAELRTLGDLAFVEHASRPSVTSFMESNQDDIVILNGVLVRSISHDICRMLAMTGNTSGTDADWPTILGASGAGFTIPHLAMSGPSYPGPLVTAVARTGGSGQLEALLSGSITDWSDTLVAEIPLPVQNVVDSFVRQRTNAFETAAATSANAQALAQDLNAATHSASALKDLRYVMDFTSSGTLDSQAEVAVNALSIGVSRCVSMSDGVSWDTHADNDALQTLNFENLFYGLGRLMERLKAAPGTAGGATLADETVVVVMSEMGRTPLLNAVAGKDHWPYTSMMLVGPGLSGGRSYGGFDDIHYGYNLDPASGDIDDANGQILSAEVVGATLLALADIDPAEHVDAVEPLLGVLA